MKRWPHHKAPGLLNVLGLEIRRPDHYCVWHRSAEKKASGPYPERCADIWSQGYSEPNSGSDLGSLQTRAVDQGDYFLVNGQKVWTSLAHYADWCLLLVRTDPDAPKHNGLSALLVDMHSPGITIKPLRTMTGESEFNEVFFENVQVPKANLLGEMNQGWKVIITSLMFERQGLGFYFTFAQKRTYDDLRAVVCDAGPTPDRTDPRLRQKMAQAYIDCEVLKLNNYRALTRLLRGNQAGPEGSIAKLHWAETNQRMQDLAVAMQGTAGQLYDEAEAEHYWQYGFSSRPRQYH